MLEILLPFISLITGKYLFLFQLDWFELKNNDESQGKIHLSIKFTSKESLEEERDREVKDAYFPLRENSRFIMYQDAETPQLPQVKNIFYVFSRYHFEIKFQCFDQFNLNLLLQLYIVSSKESHFPMVVHTRQPGVGMIYSKQFRTLRSSFILLVGVYIQKSSLFEVTTILTDYQMLETF
jgi:hypothetical protein